MSDLYPKIHTIFKRDPETGFKTLLEDQFSLPEFKYLATNMWEWTEKFNGMCLNIQYNFSGGGSLTFWGKTKDADIPIPLSNNLGRHFYSRLDNFRNIWGSLKVDLFMEGIGPGIHGGGKYGKNFDFVLFDVLIDGWWLRRKDVFDVGKKLGLKVTPVVGKGSLYELIHYIKHYRFNSSCGKAIAEGVVARPMVELKTRGGDRIITKLKYTDFGR